MTAERPLLDVKGDLAEALGLPRNVRQLDFIYTLHDIYHISIISTSN
jgi:hypothetical protein